MSDTEIQTGESWGSAKVRLLESDQWNDVDYGTPKGCSHVETMCPECIGSWENDHEVKLPCGCDSSTVGVRGHDVEIHVKAIAAFGDPNAGKTAALQQFRGEVNS